MTSRGERIRARRLELGLTQHELEKLSGVDANAISNIERENIGLGPLRAEKLERALGLSPGSLDGERKQRPTLQAVLDRLAEYEERAARQSRLSDEIREQVAKALEDLSTRVAGLEALVRVLIVREEDRSDQSRKAR